MVTVYFKVQRVDLPAIRQTGLGPLTDMAAKTKGVMPLDQTSAAIVNIIFNDGASKLGLPFSRTGLFRFSPSFAAPASDTEFAVLTSEINSEKVLVLPHSLISVAQLATLHLLRTINEIYEARAVGALHPNGSPNLSAAESHRTDFSELVSDPARLKSAWAAEKIPFTPAGCLIHDLYILAQAYWKSGVTVDRGPHPSVAVPDLPKRLKSIDFTQLSTGLDHSKIDLCFAQAHIPAAQLIDVPSLISLPTEHVVSSVERAVI